MSYILEALKKSDREYRLQQGADIDRLHLAAVDAGISGASRVWMIGVPAIFLLAAGLGYMLWSGALWSDDNNPDMAIADKPVDSGGQVSSAESRPLLPVSAAQALAPAPLHAMPPALRSRLGPLQFSLHVYSPQPAQRSIIINNRMMREGEWLDSGLQLREITEGGVIMAIEGQPYSVPVVSDWQQ